MNCQICDNTGRLLVSYANPENGPMDDPELESGYEYCVCDHGRQLFLKDAEENERENAKFFASLVLGR